MYQNVQKDQKLKSLKELWAQGVQHVVDLAWRASAARRRTSPFQRDFWRFNERSGHIKVSKSPNRFEKKNSSLELYFPPKAWRRVVGVGVSSSDGMTSELQSCGGNTHWNNSRTVFCFKIWRIFTWIYCFLCFLCFLICFVCFWVAFWTFFWSLKQTIFFVEKKKRQKKGLKSTEHQHLLDNSGQPFFHAWSRSKSSTSHDAHANVREQSLQSLHLFMPEVSSTVKSMLSQVNYQVVTEQKGCKRDASGNGWQTRSVDSLALRKRSDGNDTRVKEKKGDLNPT